ncbi:hypothetical protein [Sanguibacter suaedae]|uniref:Uncharacterized protein n=1 Tax=Sanguibacter suaedae TaxID=2795737 RepID=A0A934M6T1_9MICO|nr:hypothetical protein [Sanguibacter suaedae]MBI9114597.1 hypothetical protein [Sanguibacter suaedae]
MRWFWNLPVGTKLDAPLAVVTTRRVQRALAALRGSLDAFAHGDLTQVVTASASLRAAALATTAPAVHDLADVSAELRTRVSQFRI